MQSSKIGFFCSVMGTYTLKCFSEAVIEVRIVGTPFFSREDNTL